MIHRAECDALIVGAGLAGLVAACEVADRGHSVMIIDQEGRQSLGGQAFWSFGGLFFVNSPEQRRLGIKDSLELALRDWEISAGFDRADDFWGRQWARAYVEFAAGEKRSWLRAKGLKFFPVVGWAERGGGGASSHGNSVPRFHITWGTGPGVLEPFIKRVMEHERSGKISIKFRHRATDLIYEQGRVVGVSGELLEPTLVARGEASSRSSTGHFSIHSQCTIVTSGGLGGNHALVRTHWPVDRLGPPPKSMISGVPAHVDGLFQQSVANSGAHFTNADRMWHYTEGLRNWKPIWPQHGIRVLPGPSSLWLTPDGERLPYPFYPGADTLGTLQYITKNGYDYTWFVLNRAIIKKEFALSGSEQNADLTGKSLWKTLQRVGHKLQQSLDDFVNHGEDFVVRDDLKSLVQGMNDLTKSNRIDFHDMSRTVLDRDLQMANSYGKDPQIAVAREARKLLSERLLRVAKPSPLLSSTDGPLIAVKMNILTRKSLGGLQTDLEAHVLDSAGEIIEGLYAAGEVAGFGGGGMHGYRSLEGTFLGGCIFSGRIAGRAVADKVI